MGKFLFQVVISFLITLGLVIGLVYYSAKAVGNIERKLPPSETRFI